MEAGLEAGPREEGARAAVHVEVPEGQAAEEAMGAAAAVAATAVAVTAASVAAGATVAVAMAVVTVAVTAGMAFEVVASWVAPRAAVE